MATAKAGVAVGNPLVSQLEEGGPAREQGRRARGGGVSAAPGQS